MNRKAAIVVFIGCELNAASQRIPLFKESELESVANELASFKTRSYDELDLNLTLSEISVYGQGDLIKELSNKLTAGES